MNKLSSFIYFFVLIQNSNKKNQGKRDRCARFALPRAGKTERFINSGWDK
jgi:hypothetical protein